jgi:DnaJ-class molecular chaperone
MPTRPASDEPSRVRAGDEDAPGAPQTGEAICPSCGGSGLLDGGICPECNGEGRINAIVGDA